MNNDISFITAFKKFKAPYAVIQHSALYSWKHHKIRVITPNNEEGVRENCNTYSNVSVIDGVRCAQDIGLNNRSPIVRSLLKKALPRSDTDMVALINSDIIIPHDFSDKIKAIFKKYGHDIFLISSRKDIELKGLVNSPESYEAAQKEDRKKFDVATSSDIFITSKKWWRKIIEAMPEFVLGRYAWDNWLHMFAHLVIPEKYNCSDDLTILHCKHDHEHILIQEKKKEREAPSSKHNIALWEKTREVHGTVYVCDWKKTKLQTP